MGIDALRLVFAFALLCAVRASHAMYLLPPTDAREGSPITIVFVDDTSPLYFTNPSARVVGNTVELMANFHFYGVGLPPRTYRFDIGSLPAGNYSVHLIAASDGTWDAPAIYLGPYTFSVAAMEIPALNQAMLVLLSGLIAVSWVWVRRL